MVIIISPYILKKSYSYEIFLIKDKKINFREIIIKGKDAKQRLETRTIRILKICLGIRETKLENGW